MDNFEAKSFWNIFNSPDPVVTLSTISSTIMSSTTTDVSTSDEYAPYYANDVEPPSDLHMLTSTAAQKLNQQSLSAHDIRGELWLQFLTVTGLAFAASILIVLIVALTWAAAGSKTAKYIVADSEDSSAKNESNPMMSEESV